MEIRIFNYLTRQNSFLVMVVYIIRRIFYFKWALKAKPLAQIINEIQALKGLTLHTEYSSGLLLDKTHVICHKIQRGIMRDKQPCLVRALVLYEICVRQGVDAYLVVGAVKANHHLEGHAWLELGGMPFRDNGTSDGYVETIRYAS